jgi:NAD(P)-dependent dehydrogenase (short-subunit alcohol dehydrogenase family)
MGKLEGKIALVTGGNSGIGLATAKQFVNEGAYVFITGRRDPDLAAAVKEIGRNVTGVHVSKPLDLCEEAIKIARRANSILCSRMPVLQSLLRSARSTEEFDVDLQHQCEGPPVHGAEGLPLLPDGASIILNASIVASRRIAFIAPQKPPCARLRGHGQRT